MRPKRTIYSIAVIFTFLLALYGKKIASTIYKVPLDSNFEKIVYGYFWWILPTFLLIGFLFGFKNFLQVLGLNKGLAKGFIFAIITVSPMFLSSAFIGHINSDLHMWSLIHKTVLAGTMEEYLFRGFLFGILFRKLNWGFIPATLIGALLFGIGHLYQGTSFIETISIFLITSFGAIWFSWLYIEWNENLWIPIFLHIFMNLSWILFDVSSNAMGGIFTNIFRIITIVLTIVITIRYHKKRGLNINRNNLLINKA